MPPKKRIAELEFKVTVVVEMTLIAVSFDDAIRHACNEIPKDDTMRVTSCSAVKIESVPL